MRRWKGIAAASVLALVTVAIGTVGLLSPNLSNVVDRDLGTVQGAVGLAVGSLPGNLSAGDIFTVEATLTNNAHRPLPTVLRMEVRNGDGISPADITLYAGCSAEEQVSSKTLRYYIGSQGPLLAPNGTSFPIGTTVAAIEASLGSMGHWQAVLGEIQARDPKGYQALVTPGLNASSGVRATPNLALKALNYYGMVAGDNASPDPRAWHLTVPFGSRWTPSGDGLHQAFEVEISPNARGSYSLKFWAERPDGLGVPNHPWQCGSL